MQVMHVATPLPAHLPEEVVGGYGTGDWCTGAAVQQRAVVIVVMKSLRQARFLDFHNLRKFDFSGGLPNILRLEFHSSATARGGDV